MIIVVNRRKTPEGVYVGRGTPLGNPFHIGKDGTREEVIRKYAAWLKQQPDDSEAMRMLRDLARWYKRDKLLYLACWCAPKPCHADVISSAVQHLAELDR